MTTFNRRSMPVRGRVDQRNDVWLRVYDISNGKAATWSQLVLGKKIEGVWHTGVLAYGLEYFYGGGIDCMLPAHVESSFDMEIVEIQLLGYTNKTRTEFERFLTSLREKFTPETYDLARWNCNHFTDTCARFLLDDRGIPEYILDLPETIASSFIGDLIFKFFKRLHRGRNPVNSIDDPDHPRFELEHYSTRSRRGSVEMRRRSVSRSQRRSSSCDLASDDISSASEDHHRQFCSTRGSKHSNPKSTFSDTRLQPPPSSFLQYGRRASSHTNPSRGSNQLQPPCNTFLRSRASQQSLINYKEPSWATPPPSPILQPFQFPALPHQKATVSFSPDLDPLKARLPAATRPRGEPSSEPPKPVSTPQLLPRRHPQHQPPASSTRYVATPPRTPTLQPTHIPTDPSKQRSKSSQRMPDNNNNNHHHNNNHMNQPSSHQPPRSILAPLSLGIAQPSSQSSENKTPNSTPVPIARPLIASSRGSRRPSKSDLDSALIFDVNRVIMMSTAQRLQQQAKSHRSQNSADHPKSSTRPGRSVVPDVVFTNKRSDGSGSMSTSASHSGELDGLSSPSQRSTRATTPNPESQGHGAAPPPHYHPQHRSSTRVEDRTSSGISPNRPTSSSPKGDHVMSSSSRPFSTEGVHQSVPVVDLDEYYHYDAFHIQANTKKRISTNGGVTIPIVPIITNRQSIHYTTSHSPRQHPPAKHNQQSGGHNSTSSSLPSTSPSSPRTPTTKSSRNPSASLSSNPAPVNMFSAPMTNPSTLKLSSNNGSPPSPRTLCLQQQPSSNHYQHKVASSSFPITRPSISNQHQHHHQSPLPPQPLPTESSTNASVYKGVNRGLFTSQQPTPTPSSSLVDNLHRHHSMSLLPSHNHQQRRCPECKSISDRHSWMCDACGFDFMVWPLR